MIIQQISIFLENVAGRLAEVTKLLAKEGINIRAMTIADTADFGILRIVVDQPDKTLKALRDAGFTARATEVLAVEVEDKPGGLAKVMEIFKQNRVNIEYLYVSLEKNKEKAVVIFKVEDLKLGKKIVEEHGLGGTV
ncbi:MAG: ACT domain-containing protein, partial [Spirochaetales bacterium]|nr:ACT domain-containing protein [Spirochaetales bacterium]